MVPNKYEYDYHRNGNREAHNAASIVRQHDCSLMDAGTR